jgi:hypothetical protein
MTGGLYFTSRQKGRVGQTFELAARLTREHFGILQEEWKNLRYDVKTRAHLEDHEVNDVAFAHLCKYTRTREQESTPLGGYHFYRVCLQDDRILDAVERGSSFIKLSPLMLYIATHELVHILRFDRGESDFHMPWEARKKEEGTVHDITRSILRPAAASDMNLVLDCFSNDYLIEGMAN